MRARDHRHTCVLLLLVLWAMGCPGQPTAPTATRGPTGQLASAIINGQPDSRHPAVGAITVGTANAFCTGTLVTPKLVVTAAHCVDAFGRYGGESGVRFRIDGATGSQHHRISQAIKHPSYNPRSQDLSENDIAVLILSQEVIGTPPIEVNTTAIDATWVGRNLLVMGYGLIQTQPQGISATQKYAAEIPIYQVSGNILIHYDQQSQKSACHGDSGGPALYNFNGTWKLVGVTSTAYKARQNPSGNPPTLCDGGTVDCRPDAHYSSFLLQYINQTGGGCQDGTTEACYGGPTGTENVGTCKGGTRSCSGGQWGACQGHVLPTPKEVCFDNLDNNCNGQIDEGCGDCQEGETRPCYGGPPGTENIGICRGGFETCRAAKWSACEGAVTPAAQEICGDTIDNNCNGLVDENCCPEGQTDDCYTGPPNTWGVGICKAGKRICRGGQWGACEGEVKPQEAELCQDRLDNNCDGQTDEGCPTTPAVCQDGAKRPCYSGPPNTQNIGICRAGEEQCIGGQWSICHGAVLPQQESCGDRVDNDCNGQIDEGCDTSNPKGTIPPLLWRPRGSGCQSVPSPSPQALSLLLLGLLFCCRRGR